MAKEQKTGIGETRNHGIGAEMSGECKLHIFQVPPLMGTVIPDVLLGFDTNCLEPELQTAGSASVTLPATTHT